MRLRRIVVAACLTASVAGGVFATVPAHAAGGLFGTGSVTAGCSGGTAQITGLNTASNNWIFDVTVACFNAAPQHIVKAGTWNPDTGGVVAGFDTGSLQVGRVGCGANPNVTVQAAMLSAPLQTVRASITRVC